MPIKRETETPGVGETTGSGNHAQPDDGTSGRDSDVYSYGETMVAGVCAFFRSADDRIGQRLANSRTSVAFHLSDAEPLAMTIYLDRVPIEAEPDARSDADVDVWGKTDSLAKIFLGRDHMALMIARGEIEFEGPVRRVLRAVPIMRKLDVDHLKDLAAARRDIKSKDKPDNGEGAR